MDVRAAWLCWEGFRYHVALVAGSDDRFGYQYNPNNTPECVDCSGLVGETAQHKEQRFMMSGKLGKDILLNGSRDGGTPRRRVG